MQISKIDSPGTFLKSKLDLSLTHRIFNIKNKINRLPVKISPEAGGLIPSGTIVFVFCVNHDLYPIPIGKRFGYIKRPYPADDPEELPLETFDGERSRQIGSGVSLFL